MKIYKSGEYNLYLKVKLIPKGKKVSPSSEGLYYIDKNPKQLNRNTLARIIGDKLYYRNKIFWRLRI